MNEKYRGLRTVVHVVTGVGWLLIIFAVIIFIVGVDEAIWAARNYGRFNGSFYAVLASWKVGAAILAAINGFICIVIGEAISVFIDIALNTEPIAQMAEHSAATREFLEQIAGGAQKSNQTSPKIQSVQTTNDSSNESVRRGTYGGYEWTAYPDGRVETTVNGERMTFPSSHEFTRYVDLHQQE